MKALAALLLSLAFVSAHAEDTVGFQDSGTASFTITNKVQDIDGAPHAYREYKQTSVDYTPIYQYILTEDLSRVVLVKATTTSVWSDMVEGVDETTQVEAFVPNAEQKYDKAWEFSAPGAGYKTMGDELAAVTQGGCCGAPNLHGLYRIADGGYVASVQEGSFVNVRAPSDLGPWAYRYVGYAYEDGAPEQTGYTYITTFTYFTAEGRIEKMHLYGKMIEEYQYAEVMNFNAAVAAQTDSVSAYDGVIYVDLWGATQQNDPQAIFGGFSVTGEVSIDYNGAADTFDIKFSGDNFDRENSTFSERLLGVFVD